MNVGVFPVFTRARITDPRWTAAFARGVESIGAESVWAVEHVVVAEEYEPRYPYSPTGRMAGSPDTVMPDPLDWLMFVAASTTTLRLGTGVVVAPLHPAPVLAKRAATVDALSGGRLMLGVGSGWQIEEYRACGVPYEERGARLDETIAALRVLWRPGPQSFTGRHVAFDRVESLPDPVHGGVPIHIGGSSAVAARRAGRSGDGFFPFVVSPDMLRDLLVVVRDSAIACGRDPDTIEVTAWPGSWKPGGSADAGLLRAFIDAGADRLIVSAQESGSHEIDDIARFVAAFIERAG